MMRIAFSLVGILFLIGGGTVWSGELLDVSESMVQIESRPGIQNRILIYRPNQPVATVILFPDGNGRFDITHVFNAPYLARSKDVPLEIIDHLLRNGTMVVLMDAPADHRSMLGVNGWHGPTIFRISRDHALDIGAIVQYFKEQDPLPIYLAGIRMGGFSAATAAIHLQDNIAGLILVGGITECPEQKALLQLCPQGLMGMPLHEITVPTLILSGDNTFPEPKLASALSHSPSIQFQTFPEFAAFESWKGWDNAATAIPGVSNAEVSREMADFIRWNEITNPALIYEDLPEEMSSIEIYLVGCYY